MSEQDEPVFTSEDAYRESRALWLKIGRACAQWAEGGIDDLSEVEWVDNAMQYAARAEACFWRATGEAEAFDYANPLAPPPPQERDK